MEVLQIEEEPVKNKATLRPFLKSFLLGLVTICGIGLFVFGFFVLVKGSFTAVEKKNRFGFVNITSLPTEFDFKRGLSTDYGSWFNTDEIALNSSLKPSEATNGRSWCGYKYNDTMIGFAPSLLLMCKSDTCQWYDKGYKESTTKFCGLEAWVYNPRTKRNVSGVVLDAFVSVWISGMNHTFGSIDVTPAMFTLLGEEPVDKKTVIQGILWGWTGRMDLAYSAM